MQQKKKRFNLKGNLIAIGISLVVGVCVFLLVFFINKQSLIAACDGALLAGIILLSISVLMLISYEGFFDFAAYGFKQTGAMIFSKKPNSYNDFAEYKKSKAELRKQSDKYSGAVAITGLLFVTAFMVLRIIVQNYLKS